MKFLCVFSYLEVDGFKDRLWSVQFQEEHDEDAVVGELLELQLVTVVVLKQYTSNDTQHFVQQVYLQPQVIISVFL